MMSMDIDNNTLTTVAEPPVIVPVGAPLPDTITFVIRQDHIARGVPRDGRACAAALAIAEQGYVSVIVRSRSSQINGESYWNPQELTSWICRFDRFDFGQPVESESFTLRKATPR